MDAGIAGTTRATSRYALAGLEAGVLGTLLMVFWLTVGSLWSGRSIWLIPNLFATTFYGSDAYRNQWFHGSWAGIALLLAIYGGGGILWGIMWGGERRRFLAFYGALTGLAVYFLLFHLVWSRVNPLISLYGPDRQLQVAHMLWGIALARSPLYAGRIALAGTEHAPAPDQEVAVAEVSSGEAIK
jgi:hypothetical protein